MTSSDLATLAAKPQLRSTTHRVETTTTHLPPQLGDFYQSILGIPGFLTIHQSHLFSWSIVIL